MHGLITKISLLGSLVIIADTAKVFESAAMLLLFGKIPGTSLMIPPTIMLVMWGILLVVIMAQQLIVSARVQFRSDISSPATKRRVNA